MQYNILSNKLINDIIKNPPSNNKDYNDGQGLRLRVKEGKRFSWIFVYKKNYKRIRIGLGSLRHVSLIEARNKAQKLSKLQADGIDPADHIAKAKTAANAKIKNSKTLKEISEKYLITNIRGNGTTTISGKRGKLYKHVYPVIGDKLVCDINRNHIQSVLNPIWYKIPSTAKRIQELLENIFNFAKVNSYYTGDNPAQWTGVLSQLYQTPEKIRPHKRHRSIAWDESPQLMVKIIKHYEECHNSIKQNKINFKCLQLTFLSACRSVEIREGQWAEIDWNQRLWIIPADRMKKRKKHVVYLSNQSFKILKELEANKTHHQYIFPGPLTEKPQQPKAMIDALKEINMYQKTTVHGLRSCFKSWVDHQTNLKWDYLKQKDVRELCQARQIENKTQNSYSQDEHGMFLAQERRILTQHWADFIMPEGN
tara:strand:+ start:5922 stop:7193 length:1272 start_codon:yes stop_codon:yes gene_type:complete